MACPTVFTTEGRWPLNLGYDFDTVEQWDFRTIQAGTSVSEGGGLGVSIVSGSISAGGGSITVEEPGNPPLTGT